MLTIAVGGLWHSPSLIGRTAGQIYEEYDVGLNLSAFVTCLPECLGALTPDWERMLQVDVPIIHVSIRCGHFISGRPGA